MTSYFFWWLDKAYQLPLIRTCFRNWRTFYCCRYAFDFIGSQLRNHGRLKLGNWGMRPLPVEKYASPEILIFWYLVLDT